jgi:PAS domain S-box-containing protein
LQMFCVVMMDFTELTRDLDSDAYRSLYELAFVSNEDHAIVFLDPDGRITSWNRGAERITGYRAEETVGRPMADLFLPEDITLGVPERELNKAEAEGSAENERWQPRKDGTRYWASGVVTCIRNKQGRKLGFLKILRDRTVAKQTEERINRTNAEITQFTHVASHELKESLRTIRLHLELLKSRYGSGLDDNGRQCIGQASDSARQLQHLIDGILQFSQEGDERDQAAPSDLASIFDTVVGDLKTVIEAKRATVTRQSMPTLKVNAVQISEVFLNLLTNALKFNRANVPPVILVDARPTETEWVFSVRDNGIGIAPHAEDRVFEAFRAHRSRNELSGTGLGLALANKLIQRHGGRMWFESYPGEGSTFYFTLPNRESK